MAYEAVVNELKEKELQINNLGRRNEYFAEETKLCNLNLENKNQEIFRLKKQLLETKHNSAFASVSSVEVLKPRNVIDGELAREFESLKSIRPELESVKELLRKKEIEVLDLRYSRESEVSRLSNQL